MICIFAVIAEKSSQSGSSGSILKANSYLHLDTHTMCLHVQIHDVSVLISPTEV